MPRSAYHVDGMGFRATQHHQLLRSEEESRDEDELFDTVYGECDPDHMDRLEQIVSHCPFNIHYFFYRTLSICYTPIY